jgi:hypothetical protein
LWANEDEQVTTEERERRSVVKVVERRGDDVAQRPARRGRRSVVQASRETSEARRRFVKRVQSYLEVPRG